MRLRGEYGHYKEHLRRLAVHDDPLLEVIVSEQDTRTASGLDKKTAALVRVAATVAVDGAPSSFQRLAAIEAARRAGRLDSLGERQIGRDEGIGCLEHRQVMILRASMRHA